ncbi:hypothetical protein [Actinokineospora enzanensis]|uniref:hypothetical protein n=1 Tax=Actinokineospora enzanensis TaxID=155975 RepID=UPI0003716E71|nr:hypothetical protein [Actinokineospora enzanensis]
MSVEVRLIGPAAEVEAVMAVVGQLGITFSGRTYPARAPGAIRTYGELEVPQKIVTAHATRADKTDVGAVSGRNRKRLRP